MEERDVIKENKERTKVSPSFVRATFLKNMKELNFLCQKD
jgi:hypothetical protein